MTWRTWPFMRSAHATGEGVGRVSRLFFSHSRPTIRAIEQLPVVAAAH
jgi:hypothetical protein